MEEALEVEPDNPDFLYNATQLYLNFYPQVAKRYEWPKKKVYHEAMKMSRKAAKLAEDGLRTPAGLRGQLLRRREFRRGRRLAGSG